jgi:hypothetical protein
MRLFLTVIRTELIKFRGTVALWLTFLYPLGTVILTSLFHYAEREKALPDQVTFINNYNNLVAFFLPFYAVLMISFFCQVEHKNSMLKHLYSLPIPKWAFYFGKLAAAFLLMASAYLLLIAFMYISSLILGTLSPKLRISPAFDHAYLWLIMTNTFLSSAALLVIQYILSLKLKNVVAPVAIGISMIILPIAVLMVLGMTGIIRNPRVFEWLPKYDHYSYPYSFIFSMNHGGQVKMDLFNLSLGIWLLIAIALAILGYIEISKRNIK